MEENPLGVAVACRYARVETEKRTKGRYPAPIAAIDVVEETFRGSLAAGLEREAEVFGRMVATDVCKNLIAVFFLSEKARKRRAVEAQTRPVRRAGVVGAGVMGGGIAWAFANAEIPVVVRDVAEPALGTALRQAKKILDGAADRRKMTRREAERRFGLVRATLSWDGFAGADVVVEAVVEDLGIKKKVLAELEANVGDACVIATNTSGLPIAEMARGLRRPANLGGLHFFNPVHRMPLVEVIRAEATSDATVATLWDLARALGKTPILVRDAPGFLVNRLLIPYTLEAARLLEEGTPPEEIDAAAEEFGMPMGPIALTDEVGIDVGYHVARHLAASFPDRMGVPPILEGVFAAGLRGKKTGAGLYLHDGDRRRPNPALDAILDGARRARGIAVRRADRAEMIDRLFLPMVAEAAWCLAEGVVESPNDVDVGMIYGTGFPPFRGGLLRWADSLGAAACVRRLEGLTSRHGTRFDPGEPLRAVAARGGFRR
jgi:3-hydroxyacyl-CoA dehydrogenase/enoyl-CoA hydratase/3-hydroxybutyryl-CoA epimerase